MTNTRQLVKVYSLIFASAGKKFPLNMRAQRYDRLIFSKLPSTGSTIVKDGRQDSAPHSLAPKTPNPNAIRVENVQKASNFLGKPVAFVQPF